MRFERLQITNFRAVEYFMVEGLGDFVVIAGQNGCGKSCVFDAIRLLKSLYGGYQANEHLQWFGEFAINVQDKRALERMFRDPRSPMHVSASIAFSSEETTYLRTNAQELVQPLAWQIITGQSFDYFSFNRVSVATQFAHLKPRIDEQAQQLANALIGELASSSFELSVSVDSFGNINLRNCLPAQVVFQAYEPDHLGVIEYHSASRAYIRQDVGGVNLDTRQFRDQRRQQGLYNWQAKYQNIKTELASAYIRRLIAEKASESSKTDGEDLNETLIDLFNTFFPDKSYLGVRALPNGNLEFPVQLASGRTHDIDELSSGEKEILYGYLRLKNSIPKGSVILLDEPELHLNPSLLQGFADFYYRHLGVRQGNQIWMVTHSDALLRQAVGNSNYDVFHMTPATADDSGINQASHIFLDDELDKATVDLVGDLATYQPHSKVVILEGEGATGFDVSMVKRLFPVFARRVNLVSGGNKSGVRTLYSLLESSTDQMGVLERFYAITDRDHEVSESESMRSKQHKWDRYHIENYLLEPRLIRAVTVSAGQGTAFRSDEEVYSALRDCARQLTDGLVMELLQKDVNDSIVALLRIGGNPGNKDYASALYPSIQGSLDRVAAARDTYTVDSLAEMGSRHAEVFRNALEDDTWISVFPGRPIMKRFIDKHVNGISYEPFVNLLLDKFAEEEFQPAGMKSVLDSILAS